MAASYDRLLAICPTSERVVQDCNRVLRAFQAVYDAEGVILEEYGERKGRREVSKNDDENKRETRGGSRRKKQYARVTNLHPIVDSVKDAIYNASTVAYSSTGSDETRDPVIGVDVMAVFGDEDSADVSEL